MFDLQGHWGSFPTQVHTSGGWLILTRNTSAFTKIYLFYAGTQHILCLRILLGRFLWCIRNVPSLSQSTVKHLWLENESPHPFSSLAAATWMCAISTCSSSFPPLWRSEWSLAGTQAAVVAAVLQSLGLALHRAKGKCNHGFQAKHSLCFTAAPPVLCCSRASNNHNYSVRHSERKGLKIDYKDVRVNENENLCCWAAFCQIQTTTVFCELIELLSFSFHFINWAIVIFKVSYWHLVF